MTSIKLIAPAKVNIFLKVLGKRKDSYHNILTLFDRISLADQITITKIPKGIVVSSDRLITKDPKDNIAYRAARSVLDYKKAKGGVRIHIKKNIPIAAGLGGGSSDAASVLAGINRLYNLRLSQNIMTRLAKRLGADVPFFLLDAPFAIGRGKGDLLKKVNLRFRPWHLVICPGFQLSTKEVYEAYDRTDFALTSKKGNVKINPTSLKLRSIDFDVFRSMLHNDLEKIVTLKKEVISKIIERLASSSGSKAILTGSGPSVFCLYRTRKEAIAAKRELLGSVPKPERKLWQAYVVRTMN